MKDSFKHRRRASIQHPFSIAWNRLKPQCWNGQAWTPLATTHNTHIMCLFICKPPSERERKRECCHTCWKSVPGWSLK